MYIAYICHSLTITLEIKTDEAICPLVLLGLGWNVEFCLGKKKKNNEQKLMEQV